MKYQRKYSLGEKGTILVFTTSFNDACDPDISFLSKSERQKAMRIEDSIKRSRFVASRSFARRAIGYALGSGHYTESFLKNVSGKPYLPTPNSTLQFNMSHTRHHLAVAVTFNEPIGIDIEKDDRAVNPHLLDYVFSPKETEQILTTKNWKATLLRGWTYKEAVLKCIGSGFTRDPKSIFVTLNDTRVVSEAHALSVYDGVIEKYRLIPVAHLEKTIGTIAIQDRSRLLCSPLWTG